MSEQSTASQSAESELVIRHVKVRARDVVFVKGIFEASEGLGAMFAEGGGDLTLLAPASRARELDALLSDLTRDVGAIVDFEHDACPASRGEPSDRFQQQEGGSMTRKAPFR